jgi:hypothetical protein
MAVNFGELANRLESAIKSVVDDVEGHEPAIETAAGEALTAAGAPAVVSDALVALLSALLGHFTSESQAKAAADAAEEPAAS